MCIVIPNSQYTRVNHSGLSEGYDSTFGQLGQCELVTTKLKYMTDLQKEFEATGYTSWINADLYPDGKIYTQEYTQWLERQVFALRQTPVVGQSEQLPLLVEWLRDNYSIDIPDRVVDEYKRYNG